MLKILITGGDGFLGRCLISQLKRNFDRVYSYKEDVRRIGSFSKRFDIVCHLAGLTKTNSDKDKKLLFDVNVNGTRAVIDYCQRQGARCVFASSSAVYKPTLDKRLINEACARLPQAVYGKSKKLAEDNCLKASKNNVLSAISLRIFNMYGPGQAEPFLVPYLIEALNKKNGSIFLKTPYASRDFVFVDDVVNAFVLACGTRLEGFTPINIGTGRATSIFDVATKLMKNLSVDRIIKKEDTRKDYVIADIKNAMNLINWKPSVFIDEGLLRCCKRKG